MFDKTYSFESMFKSPADTIDRNKKKRNVYQFCLEFTLFSKGFGNDGSGGGGKRPPRPRPPRKGPNLRDMGDLRKRMRSQNTPVGGGG